MALILEFPYDEDLRREAEALPGADVSVVDELDGEDAEVIRVVFEFFSDPVKASASVAAVTASVATTLASVNEIIDNIEKLVERVMSRETGETGQAALYEGPKVVVDPATPDGERATFFEDLRRSAHASAHAHGKGAGEGDSHVRDAEPSE
ncbi:MAG: hypothetical protein ACFB6R_05165 [Alphaproteobacteria bacterium]